MLASKKTRRGVIGAVVLAGVLAVSGYALTNTATVYDSYAGDGTGNVDQVTVTNIHYDVDSTDPTTIDAVHFVADEPIQASATVYAQLEDGTGTVVTGGDWVVCTADSTGWSGVAAQAADGTSTDSTWVCTYSSNPTVASIKALHAVVAD